MALVLSIAMAAAASVLHEHQSTAAKKPPLFNIVAVPRDDRLPGWAVSKLKTLRSILLLELPAAARKEQVGHQAMEKGSKFIAAEVVSENVWAV